MSSGVFTRFYSARKVASSLTLSLTEGCIITSRVTLAPEKYQQKIRDVLRGCAGVAKIADNLIVYGCGMKEHVKHPFAVLVRLSEVGLKVNRDKCEFRSSRPIQELTRKGNWFQWGKEKQTAFEELKHLVTQAERTQNIADASLVGLGVVLTQNREECGELSLMY